MTKTPRCVYCDKKNVRKNSKFCSDRHGAAWAEENNMDGAWCPTCEVWAEGTGLTYDICDDCSTPVIYWPR